MSKIIMMTMFENEKYCDDKNVESDGAAAAAEMLMMTVH
jgi:hypothetical protein